MAAQGGEGIERRGRGCRLGLNPFQGTNGTAGVQINPNARNNIRQYAHD